MSWSEELYRLSGLDPKIPPPSFLELHRLYPPPSLDLLYGAAARILETGVSEELEVEFVRMDGSGRKGWSMLRGEPVRDANGVITGLRGVAVDITERRQAEETIRLQADQHAAVLATTSDGFWALDANGKPLDVNDAYCRMTGYSREEMLALRISDLEAVETPEEIAAHMRKIRESGFDRFESRHWKKDGSLFDVENSVSFWPETGQILSFCRDITERKKAEAALRQSEAELKEAERVARLGNWRLDWATGQISWSDNLYRLSGLDPKMPPPSFSEHDRVYTPPSWELVKRTFSRIVETGVSEELEAEVLRQDGSGGKGGWVILRAEPVRDASGAITGLRGVALDITERKRAEAALREKHTQLQAALDLARMGVWYWDLRSDEVLKIPGVIPFWKEGRPR